MSTPSPAFSSESVVLIILGNGDELLRVNGRTLLKFTLGVNHGNPEFVAQNLAIALRSILCVVELEAPGSKKWTLAKAIEATQRLRARYVPMAWSFSSETLGFSHFIGAPTLSTAYTRLEDLEPSTQKRRPSDLLAMDCTLSPLMAADLIRAEFSQRGHSRQAIAESLAQLKQFCASQFQDDDAMIRYLLGEG